MEWGVGTDQRWVSRVYTGKKEFCDTLIPMKSYKHRVVDLTPYSGDGDDLAAVEQTALKGLIWASR